MTSFPGLPHDCSLRLMTITIIKTEKREGWRRTDGSAHQISGGESRLTQTRQRLRPDVFFHNPLVSLWLDYRLSTLRSRAPLNLCGCRLSFACVFLRTSWLCGWWWCWPPMMWWTWLHVDERRHRWEKRELKPDLHHKSSKFKAKFNINRNLNHDFGILFKSHKSFFIQKQKFIIFNGLFEV